jgi:hypothetical protein
VHDSEAGEARFNPGGRLSQSLHFRVGRAGRVVVT